MDTLPGMELWKIQRMSGEKMKRKSGALCAVLWAVLLILTGCSNKNPVVVYPNTTEDVITLTFFGYKYEPENVTVIESILSGFMKENPNIRVSYESVKGTDYYDALQKRMAAGKGDDVFMVNHDVLLELEAAGQVADLSQLSTLSSYTDATRGQMEENGQVYWVPTTVSAFGLYCNLDLLKQHGQKVPQTLGEWEAVCDYFVAQGITPIIANNDISLKTLAIGRGLFAAYQQQRQNEVYDALNQGRQTLSQALRPGFTVVDDFLQKGYIDAQKSLETKKTSDDLQEFIKGESPFMLTGAWAAGRVASMEPPFEFEVAPLPVLEDGAMLVINADTRLSVNANSAHREAAMKFVAYFTQEENIRKFADQQSSFSPLTGGSPSSVKEIQPLIDCYQAGRTVIGTDSWLDLPIWELTAQASQKLLAGESLEAVMAWMDVQAAAKRETP